MKTNPFDTIAHWLTQQHMTASEKRDMRHVLMNYATTHPVKSGLLSPYTFRYMGVAFASLVIVLGSSIGITQASLTALPNQSLYGVKLWVEEFRASNQKTVADKIAFEQARITTRFNEASTLAVRRELDETTSQIIQAGLEHSRESVRSAAETLQENNPELALQTIAGLETTFSSNARILATIEQNTQQNIGTIVLAAQQTTERIALEKVKFEKIVSLQPNTATRTATEQKLSVLTEKLKQLPDAVAEPAAVATTEPIASATVTTEPVEPTTLALARSVDETADTAATLMNATLSADEASAITDSSNAPKAATAKELVADAVEKMNAGSYSEALVSLQKAEQVLDEALLTTSLEKTYNVKTPAR